MVIGDVLAVDGDETRLLGALDAWRIPTLDEALPPVDESELPDGDFGGAVREGGVSGEYDAETRSESEYDEPLP